MTLPQQPSDDDAHRIPLNYTSEDVEFLRRSVNLTARLAELLELLLAWKIPKQIALLMDIKPKTVRNMIDDIRDRAGICDGADGIKEEAAKWIARKRADPGLASYVWELERERPEDWTEN